MALIGELVGVLITMMKCDVKACGINGMSCDIYIYIYILDLYGVYVYSIWNL